MESEGFFLTEISLNKLLQKEMGRGERVIEGESGCWRGIGDGRVASANTAAELGWLLTGLPASSLMDPPLASLH